ncbi:MAG TPA: transglutaminase-like domain-containing protein [Fimbriimonadaceae bacterium]|jgi:hypothetical protein
MHKLLGIFLLGAASTSVYADQSWLGLYMQGNKIGYAYSSTINTTLNKVPAKKSKSSTVINTAELGQALSVKIDSTSWLRSNGKPILMTFDVESGGRNEKLNAVFSTNSIKIRVDVGGVKSTKVIPIPRDASVVDDAVETVLKNGYKAGKVAYYYVLDPTGINLVKNKVTLDGMATTTVNGKTVTGNRIEIDDHQTKSFVYLKPDGDLIKVEGPMGIEMLPLPKEEALKEVLNTGLATTDLAYSTSIKPDKPIEDIAAVKDLQLKITGHDLSSLPSDSHQTVAKSGNSWIVDVHPVSFGPQPDSISKAALQQPEWVKPSFDLPADSPSFKKLATSLTAGASNVQEAAKKIHDYVYQSMTPNAGIGVLRDASEILKTKEGVCRDYAVLTATLLRAARVPSKLVSGLVYEEGSFFYHAWAEVWDGKNWVGVDSTLPDGHLTAGHIQLAQGNVDQAFAFTFLDHVTVEVLNERRA